MPHFTLQILPQAGPVLNAVATVSQPRMMALQKEGKPIPQSVQIRGLVDTGASCTCMDPSVLNSLQLTPTGPCKINTPSTGANPHTSFQYDIQLVIPGSSPTHPPLVLRSIPVASAELLVQQGFHALIGRDILRHCVLTYNGSTGLFILAY
jgi:hypothetical protein